MRGVITQTQVKRTCNISFRTCCFVPSDKKSLSGKEQKIIGDALYGKGPPDERLVENRTNFVQHQSMQMLRPEKWLNDEVINWYFHLIGTRSRRWCYVFNSFFIPKLLQELHKDPAKAGQYDYKAVKKWTKRCDILSKDKLPISH